MPISFTAQRKPEDLPHALFLISREHYVGARVAYVSDAPFSAQLLLHQCIETGAKALLKHASPDRQFRGASGHKLRAFLEELAPEYPGIAGILADSNSRKVVDVLDDGYNPIRYGEGILGFNLTLALRCFDRVGVGLLSEVNRKLGYGTTLSLLVRRQAVPLFLCELGVPTRVRRAEEIGIALEEPWTSDEILVDLQSPVSPA